jgi:hypothetical protein
VQPACYFGAVSSQAEDRKWGSATMRLAIAFSVILTLLVCKHAAAGEDPADRLVGSWRVVSLK